MFKLRPWALAYTVLLAAGLFLLADCGPRKPLPPTFVLWAWERPEDLRFVDDQAEVAIQTGFVELSGDSLETRGRRFPLRASRSPTTTLVHVQIDFEVRASERQVLLDVLHDVRQGLPPGTFLSMTALASWCDTETWLDAAPVADCNRAQNELGIYSYSAAIVIISRL